MPLSPDTPGPGAIWTDLVEYVVVVVRDERSLATIVPALTEVVRGSAIRILDLVAVETDVNGVARIIEVDAIRSVADLGRIDTGTAGLLSSHDIDLVSLALPPQRTAIVVVAEDRWAEPLSAAARRSGGEVLTGERIPRARVEAALADLGQQGVHEEHGTSPELA